MKKEKVNIKELQEHSYRYHRLMSRHLGISGMTETHYEDACREIGRLQGIEEGLRYIDRLLHQ